MKTIHDFSYTFEIGGLRNRLILIWLCLTGKYFSGVSANTTFSNDCLNKLAKAKSYPQKKIAIKS